MGERRPHLFGEVEHGTAAAHERGEQPARQRVGRREECARRGRDKAARSTRCARRALGGKVVPQRALEQREQPRQQRVVRLGRGRHAQQPEERARRRRGAHGACAQQREQRVRRRRGTRRVQRLQQCVRGAGGLETLDARGAVVVVSARVERRQLGLHRGARLEPPRPRHLVRNGGIQALGARVQAFGATVLQCVAQRLARAKRRRQRAAAAAAAAAATQPPDRCRRPRRAPAGRLSYSGVDRGGRASRACRLKGKGRHHAQREWRRSGGGVGLGLAAPREHALG